MTEIPLALLPVLFLTGAVAGLIDAIEPAAAIVERMVADAVRQLERHGDATLA